MTIWPGSIFVMLHFNSEIHDTSIYINNNMSTSRLLDFFRHLINNDGFANYMMLSNIDKLYGINILQDTEVEISLSNIIPKPVSIIDNLVNNNVSFALWTWVQNTTIPDNLDNIPQKMYLTVPITRDYPPCNTNNGMLQFNSTLIKGGVFNLSQLSKNFIKNTTPYKYIDYSNMIFDNILQKWYIESIFYNLKLKYNGNSVSYCEDNCDTSNPNGMCANEKVNNNTRSSESDGYGLKNLIKFKIESDNSITPYFISMNPEERVYYITNKYSTLYNPQDYTSIVQVPIYTNNERYYEKPEYTPATLNDRSYYTKSKIPINNLSQMYTEDQINNYQSAATFSIPETQIDKNDAYKDYAYSFYIEVITDDVYSKLLFN